MGHLTGHAVTEILAVDLHRRKQSGNSRRRHDVVHCQLCTGAATLSDRPALQPFNPFKETHILASRVTTGIQAHSVDVALLDRLSNALQVDLPLQQLPQW